MMILVVLLSAFLHLAGNKFTKKNSQSKLAEVVEDGLEHIKKTKNGESFNGVVEGVYLSIYDMHGNLILGAIPDGFDNSIAFADEETTTLKSNNKTWYVHDKQFEEKNNSLIWVRGIMPVDYSYEFINITLNLLIYALPFLVIAVALGGYYIINRAFRPINSIIAAAEKIGEGKDLSQRINIGKGKDEIYTLAHAFDHMFERLEEFFENEKRFTSDASHELRTPTAVIISQCEYALENANSLDEAKESISNILEQAKKMSSLIAQLLTLARADKGQQKLNLECISLSELAEVVIEQQIEFAEEKNIVITKKIEPNLLMNADETMLMRMMINLIENGINYGREGGNLMVDLIKQNHTIVFQVTDDGVGIAPEHINNIWERFYQVDASRNAANNSVGLGLSMVKWISQAHGGKVFVKSELGRKTIFTVVLPVDEDK